jgi:hypothetical protein
MSEIINDKPEPVVTKIERIERTFPGLRESLFEELDRLRSGETTPQVAGAFARLSGVIVRNVEIEMKYNTQANKTNQKSAVSLPLGIIK